MNTWHDIGYNLQAKVFNPQEIWVRNNWQESDYPHLILEYNSNGNLVNIRTSDNTHAGSVEGRYAIAQLVKNKLREPLEP